MNIEKFFKLLSFAYNGRKIHPELRALYEKVMSQWNEIHTSENGKRQIDGAQLETLLTEVLQTCKYYPNLNELRTAKDSIGRRRHYNEKGVSWD